MANLPPLSAIPTRGTADSYRLRIASLHSPGSSDCNLNEFIQLKAPNAERAMELAHLVTGKAVIEATRIEAKA